MIKEAVRARIEGRPKYTDRDITIFSPVQINAAICIRNEHYGNSLESILLLVQEAKKDFPFISDSEIKVVKFGGARLKDTYGIEFSIPNETVIPEEYNDINYLHKL